jgi:hypothetical protein
MSWIISPCPHWIACRSCQGKSQTVPVAGVSSTASQVRQLSPSNSALLMISRRSAPSHSGPG